MTDDEVLALYQRLHLYGPRGGTIYLQRVHASYEPRVNSYEGCLRLLERIGRLTNEPKGSIVVVAGRPAPGTKEVRAR